MTSKFQKYHAALLRQGHAVWMLLRNGVRRPNIVPVEPPEPRLTPLDLITEHLRRLGLSQQVHVRFEAAGGDFVLEDADGCVHVKNYAEAVVLIGRIWLYEP